MMHRNSIPTMVFLMIALVLAVAIITDRVLAEGGGRGIFVPVKRGAGESLDENANKSTGVLKDRVTTVSGAFITGTISSIDMDKGLLIESHCYEGPVRIKASSIQNVSFRSSDREIGCDELKMTNGDRLIGSVVAILPDVIYVDSEMLGPLEIERAMVASINFSQGRTAMIDNNFSRDQFDPWKSKGQGWTIRDGKLIGTMRGNRQTLYAALDQKKPTTMVVSAESTSGNNLYLVLTMFADNTNQYYGTNSVYATVRGQYVNLSYAQRGGTNTAQQTRLKSSPKKGTLRLAYDPKTQLAKLWFNDKLMCEKNIPGKLASGQFVMFSSEQSCTISDLRVVQGIIPPGKALGKTNKDADIILLNKNDKLTATSVVMEDNVFDIKTTLDAKSTVNLEAVRSVIFRKSDQAKPRLHKNDVLVILPQSLITMELEQMTEEFLIGRTEIIGDLKIPRKSIKAVRFNLYKTPTAKK